MKRDYAEGASRKWKIRNLQSWRVVRKLVFLQLREEIFPKKQQRGITLGKKGGISSPAATQRWCGFIFGGRNNAKEFAAVPLKKKAQGVVRVLRQRARCMICRYSPVYALFFSRFLVSALFVVLFCLLAFFSYVCVLRGLAWDTGQPVGLSLGGV